MSAFTPVLLGALFALLAGALPARGQARRSPNPRIKLRPHQTERFRLSASPGVTDGYPATIDEGRFITPVGGSFPVPWGHRLDSGWGGAAIGWVVGEETHPAPDSLEIRSFPLTRGSCSAASANRPLQGRWGLRNSFTNQRLRDSPKE